MTQTPDLLGPQYDAPARLADSLDYYEAKRAIALGTLLREEAAGNRDAVQVIHWELGLIDLRLVPAAGISPYSGGPYEDYAAFHLFTSETREYASTRANETQDIILRLHYLEFVLLQSEGSGRTWIELQRRILLAYREYIDGCCAGASNDPDCHGGVYIDRALTRIGQLVSRKGVLRADEHGEWTKWLLGLAESSLSFPVRDPKDEPQLRHRWIADYLVHLASLPNEAAEPTLRTRALDLLEGAAAYYQSTPLNDHFERRVAEVEEQLRKHWGEAGTHERMIRKQFHATLRRAEFHRQTGNGLVTAHFFREARRIIDEHRQYFTPQDVTELQVAEQTALNRAVDAGEFVEVRVPITIPIEAMNYTAETPEETVRSLADQAVGSVPKRDQLRGDAAEASGESPVQALFSRSVVGAGKVVGETSSEADNLALDVERRAMLMTRLLGAAVTITIADAAGKVGLTQTTSLSRLPL